MTQAARAGPMPMDVRWMNHSVPRTYSSISPAAAQTKYLTTLRFCPAGDARPAAIARNTYPTR